MIGHVLGQAGGDRLQPTTQPSRGGLLQSNSGRRAQVLSAGGAAGREGGRAQVHVLWVLPGGRAQVPGAVGAAGAAGEARY